MSLERGTARRLDDDQLAQWGRALRHTGRGIALVVLGGAEQLHAGHAAVIRAARRQPGSVTVVSVGPRFQDEEALRRERVDAMHVRPDAAVGITLCPEGHGLEDPAAIGRDLLTIVSAVVRSGATDVYLGEKDYELLVAAHQALRELGCGATVRGVPTVRTADGVPVSERNAAVHTEHRDRAVALSAALTAGAHAAEHGVEAVLRTAREVCEAAGVEPAYLELRGLTLGAAPTEGDARLLAAVELGGVRIIDNVGVPVGIGFREAAARAET